jgi:hypothetical protein
LYEIWVLHGRRDYENENDGFGGGAGGGDVHFLFPPLSVALL